LEVQGVLLYAFLSNSHFNEVQTLIKLATAPITNAVGIIDHLSRVHDVVEPALSSTATSLSSAASSLSSQDRSRQLQSGRRGLDGPFLLLVPDRTIRSPESNHTDDKTIPRKAEEEEMVSLDAVPAACPYLDDFIKHAALAAGKYGVGRDSIISAITFFHHEEGMGIELMSLLTPATLVSFSKDQVTEDVGMAIARLASEWLN
jgi:hypothetical protein